MGFHREGSKAYEKVGFFYMYLESFLNGFWKYPQTFFPLTGEVYNIKGTEPATVSTLRREVS